VAIREGDRRFRLVRPFDLVESKLRPPSARRGIVPRSALVEQLLASQSAPVICIVAPPGYGKTTLLAQWSGRKGHQVGWVSVDRRDNDPVVLLTYLAVALDRVEPIDPAVFQTLASPGVSVAATALPTLVSAVSAMTHPVTLVLDHVELLDNQDCLDAVAELAMRLPAGSQLALAARRTPPLPVAMLRARGQVVEVGADELAMDQREAMALLEATGVGFSDADVTELVGRTEGWPVGLYLAALARKGHPRPMSSGPASPALDPGDVGLGSSKVVAGKGPAAPALGRCRPQLCPGPLPASVLRPCGLGSQPHPSPKEGRWTPSSPSSAT